MKLNEYASTVDKSGKNRKRCMTCALDTSILDQIHEAREVRPAVAFPVISRWLEHETGKKLQPNTIRNHFVAGHHND